MNRRASLRRFYKMEEEEPPIEYRDTVFDPEETEERKRRRGYRTNRIYRWRAKLRRVFRGIH